MGSPRCICARKSSWRTTGLGWKSSSWHTWAEKSWCSLSIVTMPSTRCWTQHASRSKKYPSYRITRRISKQLQRQRSVRITLLSVKEKSDKTRLSSSSALFFSSQSQGRRHAARASLSHSRRKTCQLKCKNFAEISLTRTIWRIRLPPSSILTTQCDAWASQLRTFKVTIHCTRLEAFAKTNEIVLSTSPRGMKTA